MSLVGLLERAAVRRQEDGLPGLFFENSLSQASQRSSSPSPSNTPANVRSVIQAAMSILDDEDF